MRQSSRPLGLGLLVPAFPASLSPGSLRKNQTWGVWSHRLGIQPHCSKPFPVCWRWLLFVSVRGLAEHRIHSRWFKCKNLNRGPRRKLWAGLREEIRRQKQGLAWYSVFHLSSPGQDQWDTRSQGAWVMHWAGSASLSGERGWMDGVAVGPQLTVPTVLAEIPIPRPAPCCTKLLQFSCFKNSYI